MGATILVIEDNATNLELMTYLLRAFGHRTLTAGDGAEGLETARRELPNLIVCDVHLPSLDGYEVARRLAADEALCGIPLVAVTALAMLGDREKLLAAGFDGYISKPIDPETFVTQVESFLAAKREHPPSAAASETRAPATILVVDDRRTSREFLVSLLGYKGYRVLEAADGADALEVVRSARPNLVISDILMPTMDGYEFVRRLRAEPEIAATAVVFYTAHYLAVEARRLAAACGVSQVVTKPAEPEAVLRVVEESLGMDRSAPVAPPAAAFDREHLRLMSDKLWQKVDALNAANSRLAALYEFAQGLATERDPARLLASFCHSARRIVGARYALVAVLDESGQAWGHLCSSGMSDEIRSHLVAANPRHGVLGHVLVNAHPVRLRLGEATGVDLGLPAHHPPVESLLAVPIASLTHVYGWLCLTDRIGVPEPTPEDEQLAGALAAQVGRVYEGVRLQVELGLRAAALEAEVGERRRAEEAVRRQALRLENLRAIDHAILAAETPTQIAAITLPKLRELVPAELAAVVLFDSGSDAASVIALSASPPIAGADVGAIPLAEFAPRPTFEANRTLRVDDISTLTGASKVVGRLAEIGMRSLLTQAIHAGGSLLGVLTLATTRAAAFGREHEEITREVSDQLGIAILQSRLHLELASHATDLERRVAQRTARIEAVNRELESFSYSVSHDLRSPLRAIEGFGKAVLEAHDEQLPPESRELLGRIIGSTEQMQRLIDDLLRLARTTAGDAVAQTVDLGDLAESIAAELRAGQPERRVELVVAPRLEVRGDRRLLRLALENLLGNAWKYTSKHASARVEIGVEHSIEGDVYFVRDDGAGFDMRQADRLFRPFQRLHSADDFEGSGIGLATVQRIIHRHGGRIWAEGALERGATFYFTLGALDLE